MKIVEVAGGTVTSTKQFLFCLDEAVPAESRDASAVILAQYFRLGQRLTSSSYFWTKDHLGGIRQMTDSSGNVVADYSYDPYGVKNTIVESIPSDFQFDGYYWHSRSGLNLALHRAYSSGLGRWINRDPIADPSLNGQRIPIAAGINTQAAWVVPTSPAVSGIPEILAGENPYAYVLNNPASGSDPSGLIHPLKPWLCGIVGIGWYIWCMIKCHNHEVCYHSAITWFWWCVLVLGEPKPGPTKPDPDKPKKCPNGDCPSAE